MEENNNAAQERIQDPIVYRELTKEQRKTLSKEYSKTPEAKKLKAVLLIMVSVFAVLVIGFAIMSIFFVHEMYIGMPFPVFFCIFPAIISQNKYENWLKTQKNIIMKRPKQKPDTK